MSASAENTRAWLALNRLYKLKPTTVRRLIDVFDGPEHVLNASMASVQAAGFEFKVAQELQKADYAQADQDYAWLNASNTDTARQILTIDSPKYPALLKQISDAPPVLFVLGDPEILQVPQLAVVGSRNPTTGGRQLAELFCEHLAQKGLTITSGLAIGVDGAAHQGALKGGGLTIGVCATGLDRIYPARHYDLAKQMLANEGALISEFSPGTPGRPENFPRRNRIISALSLGTLVVEAAERSGSLITARLANEQGREVFAIPGSINNPLARGCHKLIKQGAKLVESADDILEELADALASVDWNPRLGAEKRANSQSHTISSAANNDDPQIEGPQAQLLAQIPFEPISIDSLVQNSGLTPTKLSAMLMELELAGTIESVPGGAILRKQ